MKKRYLLTALILVVSVGFASVQGSYALTDKKEALTDKKEALTPPTDYDWAIVYNGVGSGNRWSLKDDESYNVPLVFDTFNDGVYGQITNATFLYYAELTMKVYSSTIFQVGDHGEWWSNTLTPSPTYSLDLTINNISDRAIRVYPDISSNGSGRLFSVYYNGVLEYGYVSFYFDPLTSFFIPPFTKIRIINAVNNFTKLDALYFNIEQPTQTVLDYAETNYNQGVVDTELNSVNWFEVIFIDGFGGVLTYIGNYEVLPNLKVFYIIGFTMVLAIVGFVAGQRKKD